MTAATVALTRRRFNLLLGGAAAPGLFGAPESGMPWAGPASVRVAYIASKPSWPYPALDVEAARKEVAVKLAELERKHPNLIRLTGGEMVRNSEAAHAWIKAAAAEDADGALVVSLTSGSDGMVLQIGKGGLPTLLLSRPYAGHAWGTFSAFVREGNRGDVLASSDWDDLDIYARIFHTIHQSRKSRIIVVVPRPEGHSRVAAEYSKQFGTEFKYLTYPDLKAAYDSASPQAAEREADRLVREAARVVEPSRAEIVAAMRFYLGVRELLHREKANGITIDCLGGIIRKDLPGYPCVAWSRLDDEGLYGVCQADLPCTMSQVLMTPFSGKPGYLFNTVFDTSRNEVIQSHCVAPTALHGVGGARSPYALRSHLETAEGVSMQVLMPIGETVTVCAFDGPRKFLVSTAEVVGNVESESGCRTQIRTRVRDAEKLLAGYKGGLAVHRVTFYGDYVWAVRKMGRLIGFDVVQEG